MTDYSEDISISSKSSLFASSNPNDDMWQKFALPPTPPRSPTRSFGESTECNDTTEDIANHLQDVCDSLDSAFDIRNCAPADSKNLRSKLISDCMWSGNHSEERHNPSNLSNIQPKLSIDVVEDLFPTPCASPIPNVSENVADYPSSSDCVDPTTVFPLPHQEKNLILSGQSDTDEEIDVVTVDSISPPPTPSITIGIKRKHQISNTIILAKVQTQHSTPTLKRTKSAPSKVISERERIITRRAVSCADDSDPETKRTTHNVLERKRRIDLKKSFERLRECVPNLEKIDKTPKVIVLKKAAMHIEDLNRKEVELQEQKLQLTMENEVLSRRVELLRAACNVK